MVQLHLGEAGFAVHRESDGRGAMRAIDRRAWDLVLLDLTLPGADGWDICRYLRQRDERLPVIIVSARASEAHRVLGLELGADDYLAKPFSMLELVARVRALLRRAQRSPPPDAALHFGTLRIDPLRREVVRDGDRVLVIFDVPSDAVACAVAVQRACERHNRRASDRLDVRIGIQLGEASHATLASAHPDDLPGPAVQAKKLCDAAAGGQILVSDLVATLARSEASRGFVRAGLLELPGLPEPVATFEVHHTDTPVERPPLPAELASRPKGRCSFVGRGSERERLREVWAAAATSERRLAFVMGEPGIGKSRLAEATSLYEAAAACRPADAMERLDVERAKAELE